MYVIKDELNHFEEKFAKNYTYRFSYQKDQMRIRIPNPDPAWPESSGSDRIRIH
jgi:hypothetical protein